MLSDDGDKWSVKFDVRDLWVTWILPFVDGLRLQLPGSVWSFLG